MNFLAHLHLSGDSDELKIGNFIGDFVKGSDLERFSDGISKGIRLHRVIDSFTDSHPVVLESKIRLRKKYRHYSGVIVDVYYDHFLAAQWSNYSDTDLYEFAESSYRLIRSRLDELPDRVAHLIYYMRKGNWLYNYQYVEGIRKTLTGMSSRTRFDSKMEDAHVDLRRHYKSFEAEFNEFYPELQERVRVFINEE